MAEEQQELEKRINELASDIRALFPNYLNDMPQRQQEDFQGDSEDLASYLLRENWTEEEKVWLFSHMRSEADKRDYGLLDFCVLATGFVNSSIDYLRNDELKGLFIGNIRFAEELFEMTSPEFMDCMAELAGLSSSPKSAARRIFEIIWGIDFISTDSDDPENLIALLKQILKYAQSDTIKKIDDRKIFSTLFGAVDAWKKVGFYSALEQMEGINPHSSVPIKQIEDNESFELAVSNIVKLHGNAFKRVVYESLNYTDTNKGKLIYVPQEFITLTNPQVIFDGLQGLAAELRADNKAYSALASVVKEKTNILFRNFSMGDIRIYADEIIDIVIQLAQSKPKIANSSAYQKFLGEAAKRGIENISFKYLSRTEDELRLGDLCGDCTASDGINSWAMHGWLLDPTVQIVKLYENGKFMGKLHLMLGDISGRNYNGKAIILDAMEFIPQARENEEYRERATAAFEAGLNKLIELSKTMNLPLYLNPTSNSRGAETILVDSFGKPKSVKFAKFGGERLIKGILEKQGFVVEYVPYYIQSLGDEQVAEQEAGAAISNIERLINDNAASHPEEPFVVALRSGNIVRASLLLSSSDIYADIQRIILKSGHDIFIDDVLRRLYSPTGISGEARLIEASNYRK